MGRACRGRRGARRIRRAAGPGGGTAVLGTRPAALLPYARTRDVPCQVAVHRHRQAAPPRTARGAAQRRGSEIVTDLPDYKFVKYESLDDGSIVRILLDRPRTRNAQSRGLLVELNDAFLRAEADDDVRVVILGGV